MDTDTVTIRKIIQQAQTDPQHLQRIVKMALSEYDKHVPLCGIDSETFLEHCQVISDVKKAIPVIYEMKETLISVKQNQEYFKKNMETLEKGRKENADGVSSHNDRLTVLETEKKTGLVLIVAGLSALMSVLTLIVAVWAVLESRKEVREMKDHTYIKPQIEVVEVVK